MVVAIKNPKLVHQEPKKAIIYKSHIKDDKVIPTNITPYEMMFIKNPNKIKPEHRVFIDSADPTKFITYEQLHQDILKIAAGLKRDFNFQPGDVLALCCPNDNEFPAVFHAAVCAGGIIAAIPHSSDNFRTQDALDDLMNIKPKVVVMYREFLEKVLPHLEAIGIPKSHVLVIADKKDRPVPANSITQHIRTVNQEFLSEPKKYSEKELANACYKYTEEEIMNSPSFLFFTSGSTGKRKAVINTQHSVVSILLNCPVTCGSEITKILGCNKFFHCSSLILALHIAIYSGAEVYVDKRNSLEDICIAIQKYKINSFMALFYAISEMCQPSIADNYDLTSLTVIYNIGTRLHHSAVQRLMERHGITVVDLYGMTETLTMFENTVEFTKKGSSGRLLSGYEARLVDEDGFDVPKGEEGQLCIRGPTICKGYFKDPEATADLFDSNGFLYTGDLMRCDDDGLFYYIDRFKDMLRYYEISIFPTTIESAIMKHPKVVECGVVGIRVPPTMIEVPRGYVRLYDQYAAEMEDEEATKNEIIEFAAKLLPDEMRLRGGLYFTDTFPRTYSGKIRRYGLKVEANKEIMEDYKAGKPILKLSVL